MRWHKLIRVEKDGMRLAADVSGVIAVNRGETGATSAAESVSHVQVVQDSRRRARDSSTGKTPNSEEDSSDR